MLCSRRLLSLVLDGTRPWRVAGVHCAAARSLQQFARALRPHAPHLRVLEVSHCRLGGGRSAATRSLIAALPGAARLERASVTLAADPGRHLRAWGGRLPALRALTLVCHASLTLPPEFSALPGLRSLEINASGAAPESFVLAMAPGCLPPALEQLTLSQCQLDALPPAVRSATQLTRLAFLNGLCDQQGLGLTGVCNLKALQEVGAGAAVQAGCDFAWGGRSLHNASEDCATGCSAPEGEDASMSAPCLGEAWMGACCSTVCHTRRAMPHAAPPARPPAHPPRSQLVLLDCWPDAAILEELSSLPVLRSLDLSSALGRSQIACWWAAFAAEAVQVGALGWALCAPLQLALLHRHASPCSPGP